ncbi:hypothetical protein PHMEG_00033412 [Phytophthora megakarya]|uniref:Uncharacterized protein n=1 Tax=Phytophthora megakarya TaxID=4795 RepID=A0A225UTG0_9STRA|nr:hypothetical protein PHMEG_00033412 [Phytophthora megakarya]
MTLKLWNIMKGEMLREFRQLTLQAKVLITYLTAINVLVNELTNAQMRIVLQRKQPMTLTAVVQEGVLEWDL